MTDRGSRGLRQIGVINSRGLGIARTRPAYERGNAYPAPNYLTRTRALGIPESWDCKPSGGEVSEPKNGEPPCFVAPRSLFDGRMFPRLTRGNAPLRPPLPDTPGGGAGDALKRICRRVVTKVPSGDRVAVRSSDACSSDGGA